MYSHDEISVMNISRSSIATAFSVLSLGLLLCALFYPMFDGGNSVGYFALSTLFIAQILIALIFRDSGAAFLQGDIARFTPDTPLKTGLLSLVLLSFLGQAALFVFAGDVVYRAGTAASVMTLLSGIIVFSYLGLYFSVKKQTTV